MDWSEFIKEIAKQKIPNKTYHKTFVAVFGDYGEPTHRLPKTTEGHLKEIFKYFETECPALNTAWKKQPILTEHLQKLFADQRDAAEISDRTPTSANQNATEETQEVRSHDFIGRDDDVKRIHNLTAQGAKCILILAPGGTGKTLLAKNYLTQAFGSYIEFPIAKERRNIASVASLVEEKLRQLNEEPGREFMVSLDRLKRKLQQERIGVLIDNLEPALDGNDQFVEEHRDYIELLRVLTDSSLRSTTLITSRESLNEGLDIQIIMLGGLKAPVWQTFFSQQGINADTPALAEVHKAYGGNALAMKILCDEIKRFHDGDLAAYWQTRKTESGLVVEQALENLIREQFDRLQSNFPEVYKLLCRMGCFRYQDVPTVPKEGLISLLWDVSKEKHSRVILSLRNCPLIELEKGEYFLHPAIRAEAISRLRASSEWEESNIAASDFCHSISGEINSSKDGLILLESFYHAIEGNDFQKAVHLLIPQRDTEFDLVDVITSSKLRTLGYVNETLSCLETLSKNIDKIINPSVLSHIYGQSGDLCAILGRFDKAIIAYKNSLLIIKEIDDRIVRTDHLVDTKGALALLYAHIGDYSQSEKIFNETLQDTDQLGQYGHKYLCYIYACLSFLGCLNNTYCFSKQQINHSIKFLSYLECCPHTWIRSYRLYYLARSLIIHQNYSESQNILSKLQVIATENSFRLAENLVILGEGYLFVSQSNYLLGIAKFFCAEQGFQKIGAKYELADTYFQLGLTYQAMGEHNQAEENRAKAIELFKQMEAPKQIERVNKAFEQGAMK
jgi:tetratricopeptide (TPR) repeat protein